MGTTTPLCLQAFLNLQTILSRSAAVASIGTRSLSWRFTPQAPISPSTLTISVGGNGGRTKSPKGSRPRFPSVHSPKENLCSGLGWYEPLLFVMTFWSTFIPFYLNMNSKGLRTESSPFAFVSTQSNADHTLANHCSGARCSDSLSDGGADAILPTKPSSALPCSSRTFSSSFCAAAVFPMV